MRKSAITVLVSMLVVMVASITLVFTMRPKVGAYNYLDFNNPDYFEKTNTSNGIRYYKLSSTGYDYMQDKGWNGKNMTDVRFSVSIPEGVTEVEHLFYGYDNYMQCWTATTFGKLVKFIYLPDTLQVIGNLAFEYCDFASITIPANVVEVATNAFDGCYLLELILVENPDLIDNPNLASYKAQGILHKSQNTVTFETGEGSAVDSVVVNYDYKLTRPTNPTRDGYTFLNWYTDEECTQVYDFNTKVKDDMTLYAKWGKKPTITFDTDGGSEIQSQTIDYSAKVTQPNSPTKEGYTFLNWCTDPECNQVFSFNTSITENMTLYAKWGKNPTVTFNTKGGSTVDSQTITYNTYVTRPNDPTRSGYNFGGWCSDAECTSSFSFNKKITADTTIYAKWIKLYTVTFDVGTEGNPTPVNDQIVQDGNYVDSDWSYRDDGYHVAYWYLDDEYVPYYFYYTPITSDITLHAFWVLDEYWINFYNTYDSYIEYQVITHGGKVTKPNDPKRSHYTFLGWYTDYECTQAYDFNANVTEGFDLYAKWIRNYTVTFKEVDGTLIEKQTVNKGSQAAVPNKKKFGYKVTWYTDAECTKAFDLSKGIKQDVTLYAKWEIDSTTIAVAGGTGAAGLGTLLTILSVVVHKKRKH